MRHLWILNHYAIPPAYPGSTRHYDLAQHLMQLGYDVTILASSFNHKERREMGARRHGPYAIEEVDGIRFVWLRTVGYEGNNWRRVANMVSYLVAATWVGRRLPSLDTRIQRPDVILGSSVHLLAVLAADLLARHFRTHFVMEVRDLWPQTLVDVGFLTDRSLLTRTLRALETYLYRRAERIIVLLPRASEYITTLGVDAAKIHWIPNGVPLARLPLEKKQQVGKPEFTLMYLGAHGQVNALNVLLDAAAILRSGGYTSLRFVLVGDGPEKTPLVRERDKRGLDNVIFHDPVPKDCVPSVLEEADAFVLILQDLALYKYGVSLNKLFDYMASGKPVLLAGNPANNIVEESGCGLSVEPGNPEALARAIIDLYQMPKENRSAMGQRGRAYVAQHHDYMLLAGRLAKVIEGLDGMAEDAGRGDVQTCV